MIPRAPYAPVIVRNPRVLGGEPTVQGTRVPVRSIVQCYRLYRSHTRLLTAFPMLDRAGIRAALRFYKENCAEVERFIAENDADGEE